MFFKRKIKHFLCFTQGIEKRQKFESRRKFSQTSMSKSYVNQSAQTSIAIMLNITPTVVMMCLYTDIKVYYHYFIDNHLQPQFKNILIEPNDSIQIQMVCGFIQHKQSRFHKQSSENSQSN